MDFRYYLQYKEKCFNCGELGHRSFECIRPRLCNYCLGFHEKRFCPQIDQCCFVCGSNQHQKYNCDKRQSQKCFRCLRVSHRVENCDFLLVRDGTIPSLRESRFIVCYNCKKEGHISCGEERKKTDRDRSLQRKRILNDNH